jgi:hypothetical protein
LLTLLKCGSSFTEQAAIPPDGEVLNIALSSNTKTQQTARFSASSHARRQSVPRRPVFEAHITLPVTIATEVLLKRDRSLT